MNHRNVSSEPEDFGMAKMLLSLYDCFYELALSPSFTPASSQTIVKSELDLFPEDIVASISNHTYFPLKNNAPPNTVT